MVCSLSSCRLLTSTAAGLVPCAQQPWVSSSVWLQALQAAGLLRTGLQQQADLLLGRMWLLQPRLLTPRQVRLHASALPPECCIPLYAMAKTAAHMLRLPHVRLELTCSVAHAQMATLIVRSWPAYPDLVAVGEAHATRTGQQPSIAALAAGPFLPQPQAPEASEGSPFDALL